MIKNIKVYNKSRNLVLGTVDNFGLGIKTDNKTDILRFEFDEMIDGQASLLTDIEGEDGILAPFSLTKKDNSYELELQDYMLNQEQVTMQLRVTNGTKVWNSKQFVTNVFDCLATGSGTMPSGVTQWLTQADNKLLAVNNKIDEMDETIEDVEELETTISTNETTRQSNETTRQTNETAREEYITDLKAQVEAGAFDGEKGDEGASFEYEWDGTKLGVKTSEEEEYEFVDLQGEQGPKGEPGAIKYRKVETLPTAGEDDTIYLVPKTNPEENDRYDEWQWVDNQWEKWNGKTITADLTDYVKNTNYATNAKGGVVKIGAYNIELDSSGRVRVKTMSYTDYTSASDYTAINKRTLENVLVGKGIIDSNGVDY